MAVEAAEFHRQRFERMPEEYGPRISGLIREGLACPAHEYAHCKDHQQTVSVAIRPCFADVDAFIIPATTTPAPDGSTTGDPAFNSPWSYLGLPVVSFPIAWTTERMPVAIQLVAPRWHEADLFRAAAWCEATIGLEPRDPPL
jgi:Asp-tRNA(Asn)/Glu-tRNA(Gln) amidotransferase A subunit family amidase